MLPRSRDVPNYIRSCLGIVHWTGCGFDVSFDLAYGEAVTYGPFFDTILIRRRAKFERQSWRTAYMQIRAMFDKWEENRGGIASRRRCFIDTRFGRGATPPALSAAVRPSPWR